MSVKGAKTLGFLIENYYLWCGDAREGVLRQYSSVTAAVYKKSVLLSRATRFIMKEKQNTQVSEVTREGFEPSTPTLKVSCSTN